jgi:putative nucleotidyltransferase with HDIG domain
MLEQAKRNPNYGNGTYTLSEDESAEQPRPERSEDSLLAEATEAVALKQWVDGFLDRKDVQFPRPPSTALEIYALSRRPDANIDQICGLLQREPLLAGQVLQLANSAYYRGETAITTIKLALMRVGLASARDLVMDAAMRMTVIRATGYDAALEGVRRHSAAVAWLARLVARNTPLEAENAFLGGLMHDLGLSVGLVALAAYEKQNHLDAGLTGPRWQVVVEAHEKLGARLLHSWGIEPSLTMVVGAHHTLKMAGYCHPLIAVLMLAEHLAADAGWDLQHAPQSSLVTADSDSNCLGEVPPDAYDALRLTPRHYEIIKRDSEPILKTLEHQFKNA